MKYKSSIHSNIKAKASEHVLHLYTSKVDKCMIHRAFLASMKTGERGIIFSSEDPETIRRELSYVDSELMILKPEEIGRLEEEVKEGPRAMLIIDAGSFPNQKEKDIERRESDIDEIAHRHSLNCLCTYNVSDLSIGMVKQLTTLHNKLQLTTSDITLISGDFLDRSMLSNDSIKKLVKDNLEAIFLALLQRKAMCGSEITETIHMEFNVLLSPGHVYPLLHSLKRRGLLTSVKEGKEKKYVHIEESEPKIKRLIYEQIQAQKILNRYLQKEINLSEEETIQTESST